MKWIFLIFVSSLFSDDSKAILKSTLTDSVKVEQLVQLSSSEKDYVKSKELVDSAFSISHKTIFHRGKALSYQGYGDLYFREDSIIRALNYYQLSEFGYKDLKLQKEIAIVQYKIGKTFQEFGLYDESNRAYHKLLKTYNKIGTNPELIYSELASNYKLLGKTDSFNIYKKKLKGEFNISKSSKSYNQEMINSIQSKYQVFILENELQKANFRTDIITYLLLAIIIVLVILVAYLFVTRKNNSQDE